MAAESVVAVLPIVRRKKGLFGQETFNLVFTQQRIIFAQLTSDMIKVEAKRKNDEAKAEGKGFLSRMASSAFSGYSLHERYPAMAPEDVLAETPGNFSLTPADISSYKVKGGGTYYENDGTARSKPNELEIKSSQGKLKFQFDQGSVSQKEARTLIDTFLAHGFQSPTPQQVPPASNHSDTPPTTTDPTPKLTPSEKKFCSSCGNKLTTDANFCTECGAKQ
ncbi:MAG: zinc ribbon domain-containing protein [Candidatus Altiarchaeota archaeon]